MSDENFIHLPTITFNSKRFVFFDARSIQCAYCLYAQSADASPENHVRDEKGFLIGLKKLEEFHADDCIQK